MDRSAQARELLNADRFATLAGIAVEQVDDEVCVCTLELDARHCNARGVAMGGVLFTLADFAAAAAANCEAVEWVSLNSSIHFLAPANGKKIECRCTPIKRGRTTALFQSNITDSDSGRLLAVVETTMSRLVTA
jgi:acyl-CoA thioesterase